MDHPLRTFTSGPRAPLVTVVEQLSDDGARGAGERHRDLGGGGEGMDGKARSAEEDGSGQREKDVLCVISFEV